LPQLRKPREGVHGYGPYSNGCRCDTCRDAARVRRHEQREQHRLALREARANGKVNIVDGITHGISGWSNFMCRCVVCSEAKREESAQRPRRSTPTRTLTWTIVTEPLIPCDARRGPRATVTCERPTEHEAFHAGRTRRGSWILWTSDD